MDPPERNPRHVQTTFLLLLSMIICLFDVAVADELTDLLKLKSNFNGSKTDVFDSWVPNSGNIHCNFTGIVCDSRNSVKEIDLSNRGLTGSIPFDSVCRLENLEKLSLGFNSLSGTISKDLNNCVNLKYLDLGNNNIAGAFPEIPSLGELEYLYLNNTGFSGKFPWSSIRNATGLVVLSIGDNPFDTTPFPEEILHLNKLTQLYLSNCSIQGKIPPAIGDLTELESVEISDSDLSGEIPPEIGKLTKLWQLELYNNSLTGKLPVGFGNLTNLRYFDGSMNYLEGDLSELRTLVNLVSLQLFENELSGEIPPEFGKFKQLVNLSLYTNKLTGPLPQELGSWAKFDFIDVSENLLTGPIPPDMCKLGTMTALLILQNRFSGSIPESYSKCLTLQRFRVSNNSLTGKVPAGIWGLPAVEIIDVALNQLDGPITSDIKTAKGLGQLFAGFNKLSGELPEEIGQAESLVGLELNNNQISGKIPGSIGNLRKLSSLKLQSNILSGSIPESIGSCVSLSDVNMAGNSISGGIPVSMGSLPTLNSLNLSDNKISGRIPESLSSLRLSLLDLSDNRLSGRIPQSLSIDAYNGSFNGNPELCSTVIRSFNQCSRPSGTPRNIHALISCLVFVSVVLLLSVAYFLYVKKRDKDQDRTLKRESWSVKSFQVLSFSEDEILDSIREENLIGKGGSGNVYKVLLQDGKELAVKHIWNGTEFNNQKKNRSTSPMLGKGDGKSKEFDAEVHTLSSIRHVNVVKLFCSITSEDSSLLVYEYMPNGSLWDKLHTNNNKTQLDWETRYEIALGAAKGLEYLHHGCEKPVIHRDVKSSNILLDEFYKPRIADFGLAKIVRTNNPVGDSTHVIAGTHGYIAPEYGYSCKVNEKCDVYSFGVVLMELVTGKKPIEPEFGAKDIVYWVCSNLKNKETIMGLVDTRFQGPYREEAIKVLRIAILCTARLPGLRPTMRSVVQMLEEAEPCKLVGIVIKKESDHKKEAGDGDGDADTKLSKHK